MNISPGGLGGNDTQRALKAWDSRRKHEAIDPAFKAAVLSRRKLIGRKGGLAAAALKIGIPRKSDIPLFHIAFLHKKCRCAQCRAAYNEYMRLYMAQRKLSRSVA